MKFLAAAGLLAALPVLSGPAEATAPACEPHLASGHLPLEPEPAERAVPDGAGGWLLVPSSSTLTVGETAAPPSDVGAVFYVAGRPRTEWSRRIVTGKLVLTLATPADAPGVCATHGLTDGGAPDGLPELPLVATPRVAAALAALRRDPRVRHAEPVFALRRAARSLPDDPLFPAQWHLHNTAAGGVDLNVEPVWGTFGGSGRRGAGVRVGVVDDGLDYAHPDFTGRIDQTSDANWNAGDASNGAAQATYDSHGTAVAGIIAANANNATGVAGVAPEARLVSLRLTAGTHTDDEERQAFVHLQNPTLNPPNLIHVKCCSWGPEDGYFDLDGPGPLGRAGLAQAAASGRGNRGTVFVWAVGNGGVVEENANFDGYANSVHVIAVGAVDAAGGPVAASEAGACVAVVAPAEGGAAGFTTTDRTGSAGLNPPATGNDLADTAYTRHFGGTSAAAAQVSGVVALLLQANPTLTARDVKELLMKSAVKNDAASPGWFTNGAGFHFHPRYGAGLVDAAAAVALAEAPGFQPLGPLRAQEVENNAAGAIPDDDTTGLVRTFAFNGPRRRIEHVALTLTLPHPYPGDLRITLTSPAGTVSELAWPYFDPFEHAGFDAWTFTSVQFWGEESTGTWTLRLADEAPADTGAFTRATLRLQGTDVAATPVITSAPFLKCPAGGTVNHTFTATNGPVTWSNQGQLPPGLTLQASTGVLSGNCGPRGRYPVQIRATNQAGTTLQTFQLIVQSHYDVWADAEGLADDETHPASDPDADGQPNVLEYAAGLHPRLKDGPFGPTAAVDGSGRPVISFRRWPQRDDATWIVETSADLVTWTPAAESEEGEPLHSEQPGRFATSESGNGDGSVTATCTDTQPTVGTWFRLRAVLEP